MSISNTQFKAIMKDYDAKRTKNAAILRERKETVYSLIPEISAIERKISEAGLNVSKQIIRYPEEKEAILKQLTNQLKELKAKKYQLLTAHGFGKDYLDPIYDCSDCQDTGYIGNEKCSCLKQAIIDKAYELSNIKEILKKENFDTFHFEYYSDKIIPELGSISPRDNIKLVYATCKDFVKEFDEQFSNLILYGKPGLGKTFLCNCIAKELLDTSHTVIYLSAFQLMRRFETYRFNNEDGILTYEDIDDIYTCDLLIIDDLGSELINTFTSSELFNCLNTRLLNKKPTVISTNLPPSEWSKHYSERIVSRIIGNYFILKLYGDDIRIRNMR